MQNSAPRTFFSSDFSNLVNEIIRSGNMNQLPASEIFELGQVESNHRNICGKCSICLIDFGQILSDLRQIPNCGHVFHCQCIRGWLRESRSCPLCRGS
jgi:hypothetical protein